MNISIFGLGYVGTVSMGCLARNGFRVIGVDINLPKVEAINRGTAPIVEKGIEDLIGQQHLAGMVEATTDTAYAVRNTDVSFICVGTPSTPEGHLNLKAVFKVAEDIGRAVAEKDSFHVIVIRSTVLPGTNEKVSSRIEELTGKSRGKDFSVVSNPEFLREGSAINDYFDPPYTLVGSSDDQAVSVMKEVYSRLDAPLVITEPKVAEIMKYINNAFHAQKVVFGNEVGNICRKVGIDSHEVMRIFCMDTKLNISPYYLKPGFAYGGSCLPKDLKALKTIAHDYYLDCPLLGSLDRSNEYQKSIVFQQIVDFGATDIGFLGLSFKADTDDLRNSPILDVIERLTGKGFNIRVYDRNVHFSQLMGANRDYILQKIPYISKFVTDDYREVLEKSRVIVVVNRSAEFGDILRQAPEDSIIYDLVNIDFEGRDRRLNYFGLSW